MMLADNLKMLREQNRLTQKQVADALNIERSTYTYYERGRTTPTFTTLCRLARIFNVSIDTLAGLETPVYQSSKVHSPSLTLNQTAYAYHTNPISTLANDEQNLLLKYRQLTEEFKNKIQKVIEESLEQSDLEL